MTVAELSHRMTAYEYFQWMAYFRWKSEQEEKAIRKAQAKLRRRHF
jgi:hypothetical protein